MAHPIPQHWRARWPANHDLLRGGPTRFNYYDVAPPPTGTWLAATRREAAGGGPRRLGAALAKKLEKVGENGGFTREKTGDLFRTG